jgi:hypothetical protein
VTVEAPGGDIFVNSILTNGSVDLQAQGSIFDINENLLNIRGSAIDLQSTTGSIGEYTNYLDVDLLLDGAINITAQQGDIYVNSLDHDLKVGVIETQFDVGLRALTSIVDTGDTTADVIGRNITLETVGSIGTNSDVLEINTNSLTDGKLTVVSGGNVYVQEVTNDLFVNQVSAVGHAGIEVISGDMRVGSITSDTLDLTAHNGLFIQGAITTANQINMVAGTSRLDKYDDYLKIGLPSDLYLKPLQPDAFSLFLTGTITNNADNAVVNLEFPDDVILRGNINVNGQNSDLKIRSEGWVYIESFLTVEDKIDILGGYLANGTSTNTPNSQGSSVYVHTTSRVNTKKAGSAINLQGAKDVDILGTVVAGGSIGATGVTWAGNDATITVKAGQQIFLDTGLLASKSVSLNGGTAGADDNGLGLIITAAGGVTAMGLTSDNSGALISMNNTGNMEMMGTLASGGKLVQTFDANGNMLSQTIDWSGNYGKVEITSLGQAFIGGHTINQQGQAIETGGYIYANNNITINGASIDAPSWVTQIAGLTINSSAVGGSIIVTGNVIGTPGAAGGIYQIGTITGASGTNISFTSNNNISQNGAMTLYIKKNQA